VFSSLSYKYKILFYLIREQVQPPNKLESGAKKIAVSGNFNIIEDPKNIKFDTTIYLVAHGDDPTICSVAKLGDKKPKEVVGLLTDIFKEADLEIAEFKGKIILEGCHTAEPIIDKKSREKHSAIMNQKGEGKKSFNALRQTCKIEGSSFLAQFLDLLQEKYKNKIPPEIRVGGYLGAALEADYSISGYGKASSNNPLTLNFQEGNNANTDKNRIDQTYDENNSYLESSINQKLCFGDKDVTSAKSRC
jgi:hypothetical protein